MSSVHSAPTTEQDTEKAATESGSDSSEASDVEPFIPTTESRHRLQKRSFSLKKRGLVPAVVPLPPELHNTHNLNIQLNSPDFYNTKMNSYSTIHDDESSLDVSSPRDNNSPMFGVLPKLKESDIEKILRKREKQKAKDDSKLEKRRLKEEKLKKVADKERERDKKKQQKQSKKSNSAAGALPKIADFIQV